MTPTERNELDDSTAARVLRPSPSPATPPPPSSISDPVCCAARRSRRPDRTARPPASASKPAYLSHTPHRPRPRASCAGAILAPTRSWRYKSRSNKDPASTLSCARPAGLAAWTQGALAIVRPASRPRRHAGRRSNTSTEGVNLARSKCSSATRPIACSHASSRLNGSWRCCPRAKTRTCSSRDVSNEISGSLTAVNQPR